jgi:hypothetical protein
MYRPKNAIGCSAEGWPITKRYAPHVRTSASNEIKDKPHDLGTHHRWNSSGLAQASNIVRAGPSMVRETTISRSDIRSTDVQALPAAGSLCLIASIEHPFCFQSAIQAVTSANRLRRSLQVRSLPTFCVVTSPADSKVLR